MPGRFVTQDVTAPPSTAAVRCRKCRGHGGLTLTADGDFECRDPDQCGTWLADVEATVRSALFDANLYRQR